MKIPPKAFALSIIWSFAVSAISYFLLRFLCIRYARFLLPLVFVISIIICVILCFVSGAHYKTFCAEIKGKKLIIFKGFIIKRKKQVNLEYTVSVKTISTPLMRLLGLENLLILFEGSACLLALIKARDAELLRESITKICEKNEEI